MKTTTASSSPAFTRIELLATITTVLLLTILALPSAANNRGQSRATLCLSNHGQLILAWQLYAADNDGSLVQNYHGGEAQGGSAASDPRNAPWASGWITWGIERDNTNVNFIRNTKFARMAPYIASERNVHKCPADIYLNHLQKTAGFVERSRTAAMNSTLGAGNAKAGPWDPTYRQAFKMSDIFLPAPAETTVFLDEDPDSINDPLFWAPSAQWIDGPANLHGGAGSFSFADGHVELHQWRNPGLRNRRVHYTDFGLVASTGDPDISWMSYSSQRQSSASY